MFNKLTNYIKETRVEMKSVNWPTRKQAVNYTLLVIGASIGVAMLGALICFFRLFIGKLSYKI